MPSRDGGGRQAKGDTKASSHSDLSYPDKRDCAVRQRAKNDHEFHELNELGKRMKLTLNYCTINDVMMVDPKKGDDQKKNRKVILHVDEEDFFDMLDSVNPKNIVKYLDMRKINHRDPIQINVTENKVRLSGKASPEADKVRHGLYNANQRNRKKLNRALELLDSIKTTERL